MENRSGAELVRQALAAAKTPAEQKVVRRAIAEAAKGIQAQVGEALDTEYADEDSDPVAIAREHAIRELRAAAVDTTMRPPPRVTNLSLKELQMFEEELELARERAATIVRRSLRPPAAG